MEGFDSLREVVTHPITTASGIIAVVGGVLNVPFLDALFAVAWANVGTLFTAVSIPAFTIAPRVPWLPEDPLTVLALVIGAALVLKQLTRFGTALRERL